MNTQTRDQANAITPQQLIADFIEMLNKESFDQARKMLADDFAFTGVMGNRNGADAYHVDAGKIKSLRVIFDPRPLLESPQKN